MLIYPPGPPETDPESVKSCALTASGLTPSVHHNHFFIIGADIIALSSTVYSTVKESYLHSLTVIFPHK